jgi:hypothetical protein
VRARAQRPQGSTELAARPCGHDPIGNAFRRDCESQAPPHERWTGHRRTIAQPPVREAIWFEPQLVAIVSYSELMKGRLRDAVYRGLV